MKRYIIAVKINNIWEYKMASQFNWSVDIKNAKLYTKLGTARSIANKLLSLKNKVRIIEMDIKIANYYEV